MIRIQETESEYLVFIPAAQKQRARNIRPREWDSGRVCWVYPRTEQIYKSLLAEFGNDPTVEFSIIRPQSDDSLGRNEGRDREIKALRDENCRLQVKIESLLSDLKRSDADKEQIAEGRIFDVQKLQILLEENKKLTTAVEKSNNNKEGVVSVVEAQLRKKEQENAKLTRHNNLLLAENRKLTTAIEKSNNNRERVVSVAEVQLRKKEQKNVELTKHNFRLEAENKKLIVAAEKLTTAVKRSAAEIKNLKSAQTKAIPTLKRNEATDPTSRPNKAALSYAIDIFRDTMRRFVIENLKGVSGANVEEVIRRSLSDKYTADFDRSLRQRNDLASAIDVNFFPQLVTQNWQDAFSTTFEGKRMVQNELWMISQARNEVSHPPVHDFEPDYTGAYLYIIADVLEKIRAPEQQQKVKKVRREWEKGLGWGH